MGLFSWHRELVSSESYKKSMGISDNSKDTTSFEILIQNSDKTNCKTISIATESLDLLHGSKHLTAYNIASDIRKFEIGLFWQRAAFFWAFIVAIYTAYYHVLTNIYKYTCNDITKYHHGKLPLLVLSALGLFFCFSWLLASKGSKHWQENWENHIDLLENKITGPLHKTYKTHSYSVSKIVIAAGWAVTVCAYGLLVYEFACLIQRIGKGTIQFASSLIFAFVIPIMLFGYSRLMLGNISDGGDVEFQEKVYEGFE